MKFLEICTVVILLIFFIYILIKLTEESDINYMQKVSANRLDPISKRLVNTLDHKKLDPVDALHLSRIYINNINNIEKGNEIINDTANIIIEGELDDRFDELLILFDDFMFNNLGDFALQTQAINALEKPIQKSKEQLKEKIHNELKENETAIQDNLVDSIKWKPDAQNVHDSYMYNDLRNQYKTVASETNNLINYNSIKATMFRLCNNVNLKKYFDVVDCNYKSGDIYEQDILITVWNRSLDFRNKHNTNKIRDNIIENALKCVVDDYVICITGRVDNIWQSLVGLDFNPNIGVLKSKQMVINEIYEKSANIVSKHQKNTESRILEKYTNNIIDDEVINYINNIKQEIYTMASTYINYEDHPAIKNAVDTVIEVL